MKKAQPISDKQITEDLHAAVNLCFALISDKGVHSLSSIAEATGLSTSTINRLWRMDFTTAIRYSTAVRLAHAAGLVLHWEKSGVTVSLAKGKKRRAA